MTLVNDCGEREPAERYLFQHAGDPFLGAQPERSPLELGASFLGDHQVVEALAGGQEPMLTYTVLREPSGELHVLATFHGQESGKVSDRELDFAHSALLDTLRRQIDLANAPGTAAMRLFMMAVDPDPLAEESARAQEARQRGEDASEAAAAADDDE